MRPDKPKGLVPAIASHGGLLAVPWFAVTILVCAFLGGLGWWMTAIIVAVLASLCFTPFFIRSAALGLGGLMLCGMAGILATGIEIPLFGATVRNIPVAQATAYPGAAIFHFTDGRVLSRADWDVTVYGSTSKSTSSHELYTLGIAPIVGDGWTPDQPITAWAVTSSPNSGMPLTDWSRPSRAGVRAVSSEVEDLRKAIVNVQERDGLKSAPDAVLIHWLDDPEAAVAGQYWRLFSFFAACVVIWGILLLVDGWQAMRRRNATASRSD